ncbi:alginate export family protein [Desulfosediminicola flagellatus]|uniref:alginate export family protein n=1 Tax=Desulfosediminicola flagellatus TaxID=2569541 RepID=UPI0010AD7EE2|nr:alginate export family protein [Desulfosediminicola flagellatus]
MMMKRYDLSGNSKIKRSLGCLLFIGGTIAILTGASYASTENVADKDKIEETLKGDWGQITFNLRYRYEYVDQKGLKSTSADPIRLRLGYLTPKFSGFQAFAEFEGNTPVFADDYNDTTNDKTEYAVIADPSEGEINQGWLSYESIPDSMVKAGRQRLLLDNQRFVGAVGWRQMEQTFDAVNIFNTSIGNFAADASFIWNVRNIISADVRMQSPLLNLKYTFKGIGSLTGYGYWLDYDDPDNSGPFPYAFSTQTFGLRFNGQTMVAENSLKLLYTAEYASQSDYSDNPEDYTTNYYHLIGGITVPKSNSLVTDITGKIGYEVLGSDNGVSFKTPLGTNHVFNGWADQFLTVPPEGLNDIYASLSSIIAGIKVDLIYHDLQSDKGDSKYGTEFDMMLTKKFGSHYTLQAAYANYNADEYKTDTEKFWLQFTVAY